MLAGTTAAALELSADGSKSGCAGFTAAGACNANTLHSYKCQIQKFL